MGVIDRIPELRPRDPFIPALVVAEAFETDEAAQILADLLAEQVCQSDV